MSNHGHVTTKKHMSTEKVEALLNRLNKEIFLDCVEIKCTINSLTGLGFWDVDVIGSQSCLDHRSCWLKSKQSFEIRHGGGSDFMWWIDFVITDAISKEFNGQITDDGGGEAFSSYDVPDTFRGYVSKRSKKRENPIFRFALARFMFWGCPKTYLKKSKEKEKFSNLQNTVS